MRCILYDTNSTCELQYITPICWILQEKYDVRGPGLPTVLYYSYANKQAFPSEKGKSICMFHLKLKYQCQAINFDSQHVSCRGYSIYRGYFLKWMVLKEEKINV